MVSMMEVYDPIQHNGFAPGIRAQRTVCKPSGAVVSGLNGYLRAAGPFAHRPKIHQHSCRITDPRNSADSPLKPPSDDYFGSKSNGSMAIAIFGFDGWTRD